MNKSRKLIPALTAVGVAVAVSMAQAEQVSLSVTAASFSPGDGYGIDRKNGKNDESGGTLLDVVFQPVLPFTLVNLSFDGDGGFQSFLLGKVAFNELDAGNGANEGVNANEMDELGVSVSLTLTGLPNAVVSGAGKAFRGPIEDLLEEAVDYTLTWTPLKVPFGDAGSFAISLNAMSFSDNGAQDLMATVTWLPAPSVVTNGPEPAVPVPEPATLALAAIALVGIGASRRRRTA